MLSVTVPLPDHFAGPLTDVELEAFLDVGVAAAPGLVVLLQQQHLPTGFGQRGGHRQAPDPAADDDHVQLLWDLVNAETWNHNKHRRGACAG